MTAPRQWIAALDAADARRPEALAGLVAREPIPDSVRERVARWIAKQRGGRPSKRDANGFTEKQKRGAEAYRLQHRLRDQGMTWDEAATDARDDFPEFSEARLKLIAQGGVKTVNAVLKHDAA